MNAGEERERGSGETREREASLPGNKRACWCGEGLAGGDVFGPTELGRGREEARTRSSATDLPGLILPVGREKGMRRSSLSSSI